MERKLIKRWRSRTAPELLVDYTHYDYSLDRASEQSLLSDQNPLWVSKLTVYSMGRTVWSVGCTMGTMVRLDSSASRVIALVVCTRHRARRMR